MKKFLIAVLLQVMIPAVAFAATDAIKITEPDGHTIVVSLSGHPKIFYGENSINITSDNFDYDCPQDWALKVEFIDSEKDSVDKLIAESDTPIVSFGENEITVESQAADLPVRIYDLQGLALVSASTKPGVTVIDISSLEKGVYVISVNGVSFKFKRK